MVGVQALIFAEIAVRATADPGDDSAQFPGDNALAEMLMGNPELIQIVIIEKMAEGAVPHIMQQRGDPEQLLDIRR